MDEQIVNTSEAPVVIVEAQGKLYVKGWDRSEVRARSSGTDNLSLQQDGDQVFIRPQSNCDVRVPHGTTLQVPFAHSDATIKGVSGGMTIQHAESSVNLRDVGPTTVDFVSKDLNTRNVAGDLTARHVERHANIRGVIGDFSTDYIGGHLNLRGAGGGVSAQVHGAANMRLEPQAGHTYTLEAHGPVTCRFPPKPDIELNVNGYGPVTIKVGEVSEASQELSKTFTFGEGTATLELTAYGPLSILESRTDYQDAGFEFDFDPDEDYGGEMGDLTSQITEQVSEQLESQMEMLESELESQVENLSSLIGSAKLSDEQAERIRRRTQEKMAQAHEKIRRAQEKAARKIEHARLRAERKARKSAQHDRHGDRDFTWRFKTRHRAAEPEIEPVSDQERMMILNMLAEKKITAEEAETLLDALEGKSE
jgi:ElaB/YqjD/DUF883 family membrane-anchored ribosome-binding protein